MARQYKDNPATNAREKSGFIGATKRNFDSPVNLCPKCGGKIKSRTTSKVISGSVKETVTGCENYPTCDWTKH